MKTRNERWGMVAMMAVIGLIVAQHAEAKSERRSPSKRSAAHSKHHSTTSRSQAVYGTKASGAHTAHANRNPVASRRVVTRSRETRGRHLVLAYPPLRRIPDDPYGATNASYPPPDVLKLALRAYACGEAEGQFEAPYLTIIDYSRPSVTRRLWVLDVRTKRVLFNELVAHGQNSGENFAVSFSNDPGSHQSSIGLYRTEDIYPGQHGGSLRLSGLEPGFNDLAWERAIVMHGARYVSASHVERYGQLGRSWGCPALPLGVSERIIERIQGGSAVFIYYPDADWLRRSRYLHCDARLAQR